MDTFKASVIIPVYNATKYVTQAVESTLAQPETAEVILVEDGSPDESLAICEQLAAKYDKVRLLRHPGGENCGAGASRNLGMRNASYDYIAFLDADDYFLPGRFKVAKKIFASEPSCEGVYGTMGIHFETDEAKQQWLKTAVTNSGITTMTKIVPPEKLLPELIWGDSGYFSICGLVIKKSVLGKAGYMNEALRLHQDTDFIHRLSAVAKLFPGRLDQPVAIRRVHGQNRISAPRSETANYQNRMKKWWATYWWLHEKGLKNEEKEIYGAMLMYAAAAKPLPGKWMKRLPKSIKQLIRLSLLPFEYPAKNFTKNYCKAMIGMPFFAFKYKLRKIINHKDHFHKNKSNNL